MFYSLNLHAEYGRIIKCEIDDERYTKSGGLKPEFKPEIPLRPDGRPDYGAIRHVRPRGMIWKDANGRQVPDFIDQFYLNCSQRVKDIVESMQVGITWTPFTMSYARGTRQETRYYFEDLPKVDLLDPVASNMCWKEQTQSYLPAKDLMGRGEPLPPHARPDEKSSLYFRADGTTSCALFNVVGLGSGRFLSASLLHAFLSEKLTGLQPRPIPLSNGSDFPSADQSMSGTSSLPTEASSPPRRFC